MFSWHRQSRLFTEFFIIHLRVFTLLIVKQIDPKFWTFFKTNNPQAFFYLDSAIKVGWSPAIITPLDFYIDTVTALNWGDCVWFLYWSRHSVIRCHMLFHDGALVVLHWSHLASVTTSQGEAVRRWDHFILQSRDGDVYIEGEMLQRRKYRGMKWQYKKIYHLNSQDNVSLWSSWYCAANIYFKF